MNVLIVTDAFPPGAGGSGRSTGALASALKARGHHVRVVTARTEATPVAVWNGVSVDSVEVPKARFGNARARERAFAKGLARALGEEAWDVVHAQHWLSASAASAACPALPLVVTVRDYWPVCVWSTRLSGQEACPGCTYGRRVVCVGRRKPLLWPLAPLMPPFVASELSRRRSALDRARAVIAVSDYVASTLPSGLPGPVHVVPNFLATEAFGPDTARARPPELPDRYVLFVGKLEPNKAPDRVLPILEASRCDPTLPLLVAGNGRMEHRLRDDARRLRRDVRLLGWVDEERVLALMAHAAAIVFPSRWQEPLSRVLLDALGLGCVIVAEPTGGTSAMVVDGESGLTGTTVEELGRALSRVLRDEALAERLRKGAKARARKLFSMETVLPRVEALYESVTEDEG